MEKNFTLEDVLKAKEVLQYLENNTELLWHLSESERIDLYKAAGKVSRPNKEEMKNVSKKRSHLNRKKSLKKIVKKELQLEFARHVKTKYLRHQNNYN